MSVERAKSVPPFVLWCTAMIPTAFDDSMSYYEALCALYKFIQDNLVEPINNNATVLDQTVKDMEALKEYVDTYFDNLDVQEEINNKLDDMAEGGQLAAIIAEFLSMSPVFAYSTISDMTSATNLNAGCIARVLGNTAAADGDGAYYKIRVKEEGETADGILKVAIGDSLIADRIVDGNLNAAVETINGQLENLDEEIAKINAKTTHNIKFVGNDESYYPECELSSSNNGLGFEGLTAMYGTTAQTDLQGVALWQRTGKLVYNNGTQIYTMTQANDPTQTVLWTGTFGHGGDCCILNDNMYIADSDTTCIFKVDLNTGNKTTYAIPAASIKNESQNYTPVLCGVCGDDESKLYIVASDPENNDHTIKTGSTVRIYSYDTNTNEIIKLFEMAQDTCYVQGMTKDEEFFYIIGNKPFTTIYTGNILTIIDAETMTVYDKISNNSDYENEGLDFGAYEGMKGLITVCAKYSVRYLSGMYSFYGNQSKLRTLFNNSDMIVVATRSREGIASVFFRIIGTFEEGEHTYTFDNIMKDAFGVRTGSGAMDFTPIPLTGTTRNFDAFAIWDYNDASVRNRLRIFTKTGSAQSSKAEGHIIYLSL